MCPFILFYFQTRSAAQGAFCYCVRSIRNFLSSSSKWLKAYHGVSFSLKNINGILASAKHDVLARLKKNEKIWKELIGEKGWEGLRRLLMHQSLLCTNMLSMLCIMHVNLKRSCQLIIMNLKVLVSH